MIFKSVKSNNKIIKIITIATILLILIEIVSNFYNSYQVNKIYQNLQKIYEHPLRVSNQSLHVISNLFEIHRDMKDVVLYPNDEELNFFINSVDNVEKEVYANLDVIKKYILGDEGRKLEAEMRTMFNDWKPIRDRVIQLVKEKRFDEAISITKGQGAKHVIKMEMAASKLNAYAQNKATYFKNESLIIFKNFENFTSFITFLFLVVFVSVAFYIVKTLSNYLKALEQNRAILETAINDAPNPIMIFNKRGKVLLVNKIWEKLSGYKYEEINTLEKWTKKAYDKNYKEVLDMIFKLFQSKKVIDNGEYTITTKTGDKIVWKFNSAPVGIVEGEDAIISSAMDITELKNKDKLLFLQSKNASMGEMIGNIAHQWRQPLSVISTGATGLKLQKELGTLSDEELILICNSINDNAQYLSKTIDDFRGFIKGERRIVEFNLIDDIDNFLHLVEGTIKNNEINIIKDIKKDVIIKGYPNELIQCFINLFNNSKDALKDKKSERLIFISCYIKNDTVHISFKDNAGGIPENIIPNIFEPYFTTKHQSQGTGLGLSMTYTLIVEGMKGSIEVKNVDFKYKNRNYKGANFLISIPLNSS